MTQQQHVDRGWGEDLSYSFLSGEVEVQIQGMCVYKINEARGDGT